MLKQKSPSTKKRGFTLGELLAVVSVLGLLAAGVFVVIGELKAAAQEKKLAENVANFNSVLGNYISGGGAIATSGTTSIGSKTTDGVLVIAGADEATKMTNLKNDLTTGIWTSGVYHRLNSVSNSFTPGNYTVTTTTSPATATVAAVVGAVTP